MFCVAASAVLLPKRVDNGATWEMYLQEEENTVDLMFFGSSLAYCDINPAVIYQETGIASYVMAGPEQTMPVTYGYIAEALKTQQPKTILIEASSMLYDSHSERTRINICFMPWGENRLRLTFQECNPDEWLGLLFPLYAYHSRWPELTLEEVGEGLLGYGPDELAGYTFLQEVYPVTELKQREMGDYPEAYEKNLQAVEDILALCEKQGIRPVFFIVPSANRPTDEDAARIQEDLTALGAEVVNFNQVIGELGLDYDVDFFDSLHFNYRGAEKFSRYLGQWLSDQGLSPSQGEDEALWLQRVEHYEALRDKADGEPITLSGAAKQ